MPGAHHLCRNFSEFGSFWGGGHISTINRVSRTELFRLIFPVVVHLCICGICEFEQSCISFEAVLLGLGDHFITGCLLSHCLSTCGWTALIERVQRDPGTSLLFENKAIHIVVGLR